MRPASTAIILLLAGCRYDGPTDAPAPATIALSVTRSDPMTSAGDTQSLTAAVKDANGLVIPAPSLSWRSSATSVATVTTSGELATVTAVDDGTAIITAASGSAEGSITVTVRRRLAALELSGPDSIVAGDSAQLTVVGRDARQHAITGLAGVQFASSNPFSVLVFPGGSVMALFSSFRPPSSTITATITRDDGTLTAGKRIDVKSPAPSVFDFSAQMLPEAVRPEPVIALGDGIIFLTRGGERVEFKMLWSLLTGRPSSAHLHGPDGSDSVADVLVGLPLGNQTRSFGVVTGSFSAADIRPQGASQAISVDSLMTLIRGRRVYVDVHTSQFVDGEVRGSVFRPR